MKRSKIIISAILTVIMCLSAVPAAVFAQDEWVLVREGQTLETPIYKLVSTPETGKRYIITTSNTATDSAYALSTESNGQSLGANVLVEIKQDSVPYIDGYANNVVWNWNTDNTLQNIWKNYYLFNNGYLNVKQKNKSNWYLNSGVLFSDYEGETGYIRCSNGEWSIADKIRDATPLFFYEECTETSPIYAYVTGPTEFTVSSYDEAEAEIRAGITVQTSTSSDGTENLQTVTDYTLETEDNITYSVKYDGVTIGSVTVSVTAASENYCVADTYVLDYGLPVVFDLTENDVFDGETALAGISESFDGEEYIGTSSFTDSLAEGFSASFENEKCSVTVKDGKLHFALRSMNLPGKMTYYYAVLCGGKYYYGSFAVMPAPVMYFEDDFAVYADDTAEAETGKWEVRGAQEALTQTASRLGEPDLIGYDEAYASSAGYSGRSAHYVTVSAQNNPKPVYSGEEGHSWPASTFTFTGSGFDLISLCSGETGFVNIQVYRKGDSGLTPVKNWAVDTFHGYSAEKSGGYVKCKWVFGNDGLWHRVSTETVAEGEKPADEEFKENPVVGDTVYTYSDNISYSAGINNLTIYQAPVLCSGELEYGEYTVVVMPMYAAVLDSTGSGKYGFCLDAVRIYSPCGENADYSAAGQQSSSAVKIRDMIIEAGAFSADAGSFAGAVYIDGFTGYETVDDYKKYGPKNETYLSFGQGVALGLSETALNGTDRLLLGARCISGTGEIRVSVLDGGTEKFTAEYQIASATDMYYDITVALENLTAGGVLVIECTDGTVSLTKLNFASCSETAADSAGLVYTTVKAVAYAERYIEGKHAVPGSFTSAETVKTDYAALLREIIKSALEKNEKIRACLITAVSKGRAGGRSVTRAARV